MTPDELEIELFLAMLKHALAGQRHEFNLQDLCAIENIDASPEQLLAFASDNDERYGSKRKTTLSAIRFEISAEGMRHAKELEKTRRRPTWKERFASLPIGKGIWDLVKIGLGFLLGVLADNITGISS